MLLQQIGDFPQDLTVLIRPLGWQLATGSEVIGIAQNQSTAPFVDDALAFFLDLEVDLSLEPRHAICSEPEFFLIDRLLQGCADQMAVRSVVIKIADRIGPAILVVSVRLHSVEQLALQQLPRPLIDPVFVLIAFECFDGHWNHLIGYKIVVSTSNRLNRFCVERVNVKDGLSEGY